jgi:hypothetical protein
VNDAGAIDPVGETYTWTIIPPNTFFSNTPADPTYSTAASFGFYSDVNAVTFECSLDGPDWAPCTSPITYTGLAFGQHTLKVRSADALGVDPVGATYTWTILQAPRIVINGGNYATNTPNVQLDVVAPPSAHTVLLSNSYQFGPLGGTQTLPVAATIPWTLKPGGTLPVARTVFLRFPDSTTPTVVLSDGILLDTTAPVITSAMRAGRGADGTFKVRLVATKKGSGISQAQFSTVKSGGTTVVFTSPDVRGIVYFSRTVAVSIAARPRWVRVRSGAGTWSGWHAIY